VTANKPEPLDLGNVGRTTSDRLRPASEVLMQMAPGYRLKATIVCETPEGTGTYRFWVDATGKQHVSLRRHGDVQ
jgi:hypothetical protein